MAKNAEQHYRTMFQGRVSSWNLRDRHMAETLDTLVAHARGERAIGVIYLPETERLSHYFHARLSEQFDAVLHFDRTSRTTAVEALERGPGEITGEAPETFPSGT